MTETAPAAPVDSGQAEGQGANANQQGAPATPASVNAWYGSEGVTDEVKGYVKNKGWDGADGPLKAITAYQNLEKFQGVPAEQLIKLPKDPSAPGAMDEVFKRLGRPDKPEAYGEFKAPEGVTLDKGRMGWADGVAFKLGLSTAQRNALAQETIAYESAQYQEADKALQAAEAAQLGALKKEWGPKFEERSELGRRAVKAFLPEGVDKGELLNAMERAIGSANLLKMFANMADKSNLREGLMSDSQGGSFGYSPEQAKSDLQLLKAELQGDAKRLAAYNEGKGADYEKMQRLIKQANPV